MRGDSDFSPDVCVGQGVGVGKLGWRGGLSFYLGGPLVRRAGCRARGPGGPPSCRGAAGAPRLLRLPPGSLTTPGWGRWRGGGSWASRRLSPQKPKPNPPKKGGGKEGKGNFSVCWAAVPRAGAAGSGVRRWVPAARRAPGGGGLRGDPRGQPRARHRGKFSQVSPPRRCAPRCAPAAAVRSGDQRSTFWRRVVSCY